MKVAICDSDTKFVDYFLSCLNEFIDKSKVEIEYDIYDSAEAYLEKCRKYYIFIIDYNLKGKNGIWLARQLRKIDKEVLIIFVTESTEIVYETFKVNAFRFLPKPFDKKQLIEVLYECLNKLSENKKYILIKVPNSTYYLRINDICVVESNRNYCIIHTVKDKIICRDTFTNFISRLPSTQFFQCHRSYLVNLKRIKHFNLNEIIMEDNSVALLSRNKRLKFRTCISSQNCNI